MNKSLVLERPPVARIRLLALGGYLSLSALFFSTFEARAQVAEPCISSLNLECLSFQNNQLPISWDYFYIPGAGGRNVRIANQRLEVNGGDTYGGIYRAFDATGVTSLAVEYDANIANAYWGQGTSTLLMNNISSWTDGYIQTAANGRGPNSTMTFSSYYGPPAQTAYEAAKTVQTVQQTDFGNYRISSVFRNGEVSLSVRSLAAPRDSVPFFSSGLVKVPEFMLNTMQNLVLFGAATVGTSAFIDNVKITTTRGTPVGIAPTATQLAKFSKDAYPLQNGPEEGGYTELTVNYSPFFEGFSAKAYVNNVTGHLVIAYKGSDAEDWIGTNPSFVNNGVATKEFIDHIADAAGFTDKATKDARDALGRDAKLTLTGHSLGGAIAQLLGEKLGVNVATFNAPGTAELKDDVARTLIFLDPLKKSQIDKFGAIPDQAGMVNYRVYGDLVSTIGNPIGKEVTLAIPSERKMKVDDSPVLTLLAQHDIDSMINLLANNAGVSLQRGPTLSEVLENSLIISPNDFSRSEIGMINSYLYQVKKDVKTFLDPSNFDVYEIQSANGGPSFQSVTLPDLDSGEYSFLLDSLLGDNVWMRHGSFDEAQTFTFANGGVNRFRFFVVDRNDGSRATEVEEFFVGVTFAEDGLFDGNLSAYSSVTAVPEPETYVLMVGGLGFIGFIVRRRKKLRYLH